MKTILIDDEPLSLTYLENLLKDISEMTIIGSYTEAKKGLEAILKKRPEIVFLDIKMLEMNGIEMAEYILEKIPEVKLVFITAYDSFAVKAFELNAVDYILKPFKRERLIKTIRRLTKEQTDIPKEPPRSKMIGCFHTLHFCTHRDGVKVQSIDVHWRTNKAKELFAFLIHHRNQPIRKDVILDLFWPNIDWDKGFSRLYVTIYQIRKTLQMLNIDIHITNIDNSYKLDLNDVVLDVEIWEQRVRNLPSLSMETLSKYHEVINLYGGDYFGLDNYSWAESERERLRKMWLKLTEKTADYLITKGDYSKAVTLYTQIQTHYPFYEESYLKLMALYDQLGDRPSVEKQYTKFSKMLMDEYGLKPTDKQKDWYKRWKEKNIDPSLLITKNALHRKGTYTIKRNRRCYELAHLTTFFISFK